MDIYLSFLYLLTRTIYVRLKVHCIQKSVIYTFLPKPRAQNLKSSKIINQFKKIMISTSLSIKFSTQQFIF